MNPFIEDKRHSAQSRNRIILETARVKTAPDHAGGTDESHTVEIEPDYIDGTEFADVLVTHDGDVTVPKQGDRVLVGYRRNGRPIVLGTRYQVDDDVDAYTAGERIISHTLSNSRVKFNADGSLLVESDSGSTIELQTDGTVVINGGTNNPITSISTSKDTDGHVTDVSTTKSTDVYVP